MAADPNSQTNAGATGGDSLAALVSRPFWTADAGRLGRAEGSAGSGCLHCGSPRIHNDNPAEFWERAGVSHGLLRCDDCGGMFTFPLPTPQVIDSIYKESFNYKWYADHYPAKFLDALQRIMQYRRMGILGAPPSRVLDYGGGVGYFAKAARTLGYTAETYDPMYEKTAGGAAAQLAHDYDVITCHHVLEHAIAPLQTLHDIRSRLAADGRVIVAVPNAAGRSYREQRTAAVWCQAPFIHIHHFTATSLRRLAERAGLVVESEHFFERWDANEVADVRYVNFYRKWDASWGRALWPWANAQLHSLGRYAALLMTQAVSHDAPNERAELLVVLRAPRAHEKNPEVRP